MVTPFSLHPSARRTVCVIDRMFFKTQVWLGPSWGEASFFHMCVLCPAVTFSGSGEIIIWRTEMYKKGYGRMPHLMKGMSKSIRLLVFRTNVSVGGERECVCVCLKYAHTYIYIYLFLSTQDPPTMAFLTCYYISPPSSCHRCPKTHRHTEGPYPLGKWLDIVLVLSVC